MRLSASALRLSLAALMATLGLLGAAPSAFAAHLGADDPADGSATVSGQPTAPDVSRLDVDYDPAGAISLTVGFHVPLDQIDTSQNYAFFSNFTVGHVERANVYDSQSKSIRREYACSTSAQGDLSGQHHVWNRYGYAFFDQATVTGYDGLLKFTRTMADDKKSITITASGAVIAGRDYNCATYIVRGRRRGPAEHIDTRYDEGCDCWYFARDYDVVGQPRSAGDASPPLYFDGRTPPPIPACDDGIDNDGDSYSDLSDPGCSNDSNGTNEAAAVPECRDRRDNDGDGNTDGGSESYSDPACAGDPNGATEAEACRDGRDNDGDGKLDLNDPGCKDEADRMSEADPAPRASRTSSTARPLSRCGVRVKVEVSPRIEPMRLLPFSRAEVRLRGRGLTRKRTLKLNPEEGTAATRWRKLRTGRYTVKVVYLGDQWRTASRARTRTLTLPRRNCRRSKP